MKRVRRMGQSGFGTDGQERLFFRLVKRALYLPVILCILTAASGCGFSGTWAGEDRRTAETGKEMEAGQDAGSGWESESGQNAGSGQELEAGQDAGSGWELASGQDAGSSPKMESVQAPELPARFDLRERMELFPIPDQQDTGTCWAFAALAAVESSMPEELRIPLSADHMIFHNGFGFGMDGGDSSMAAAYLLSWQGPVAQEADPFGDGDSPEGLELVCHVQEIRILPEKDYEAIKRAVYTTGGVESSVYIPPEFREGDEKALCYQGEEEANHEVVIVGWDDEYPRENFSVSPDEDGAFLCRNSWGGQFGDEGYFYVSYEDCQIGTDAVSYSGIQPADRLTRIYQTDLCGWTGQMGFGTSDAWFSNRYEAVENAWIEAVGFYAVMPGTSYQVYVTGDLSGERKLAAEGILEDAGFYTVPFSEAISVRSGESFFVAVSISSPGAVEPVAVEYAGDSTRLAGIDIQDGEGYISADGKSWQRTEESGANVCLKAYGAVRTEKDGVQTQDEGE